LVGSFEAGRRRRRGRRRTRWGEKGLYLAAVEPMKLLPQEKMATQRREWNNSPPGKGG